MKSAIVTHFCGSTGMRASSNGVPKLNETASSRHEENVVPEVIDECSEC